MGEIFWFAFSVCALALFFFMKYFFLLFTCIDMATLFSSESVHCISLVCIFKRCQAMHEVIWWRTCCAVCSSRGFVVHLFFFLFCQCNQLARAADMERLFKED